MKQGIEFKTSDVRSSDPQSGLRRLGALVLENARNKFDMHASSKAVSFITQQDDKGIALPSKIRVAGQDGVFVVNDNAHKQVRAHFKIDSTYYDRCRNQFVPLPLGPNGTIVQKSLLDLNVNHWLQSSDDTRLIRTLDGTFRAFLSSKYRPLDNEDLLSAILPILLETEGLDVVSCAVTDNKFYLKLMSRDRWREVGVGDQVRVGCCIENSEIGHSALSATPFSVIKSCENGAKHLVYGVRRNHVGRNIDIGDLDSSIYQADTINTDNKAYWLKFRDIVRAALSDTMLDNISGQMNTARALEIKKPTEAVVVLANKYRLNDTEQTTVLESFLKESNKNGLNLYGLANAVTFAAGKVDSYDRATELEEFGGKLFGLPMSGTRSEINELVLAGT